jgi:hypothetical protein
VVGENCIMRSHNLYSLPNVIRIIVKDWHEGGNEECIQDIGGKVTKKETTRKAKT